MEVFTVVERPIRSTKGAGMSLTLAFLSMLTIPVHAASINFSFTGLTSAGQNSAFTTLTSTSALAGGGININTINDPELSITAADFTHTGGPFDPLFTVPNSILNVAWDYDLNINKLNGAGSGICGNGSKTPCGGLGVAGGSSVNTDALNGNDATHGDEALIFNFGNGIVAANSISFDLRGYDSPGDVIRLYVEFKPSNGSPSDVVVTLPTSPNIDTATISFSSLAGLNVTTPVLKFALLSTSGDTGFGRLAYTQSVPEPATLGVVAAVMLLFGWRRLRSGASR